MAGPGGGRDQTSNDPTGNFGASGLSQFGSNYYPIDTELTNPSASYNLPPYARQIEEAASSVDKMGHGNMNNMPMDTNGASSSMVDPAMAPPQTSGQPSFLPSGGRPSLDASAETGQDPQAGDKRKRSKASRACDECRRKKVKCDAPTELDGTPKTCTNCLKAGVNCEFERKPMKRGPSKGYISQLAERVQGLEQKQRQSFDAATGGFAESFSPDDQSGPGFQNRAPSFSSSTNYNVFSRSEYQRDRIPSVGWSTQPPGSALRPREVGSLAIGPNEEFPAPFLESPVNLKAQTRDPQTSLADETFDSRPTKRQRTQGPDDDMQAIQPPTLDEAFLEKYYQQYHPLFALLPDSERVIAIVQNADPDLQHSFVVALDLLPDLRAKPLINGNHDTNVNVDPAINVARKSLKSDHFQNYDSLQQYLFAQATGTALFRAEEDNLTMVWAMTFLAMGSENDVKHLKGGGSLSLSAVLPLARHVLENVRSITVDTFSDPATALQSRYSDEVKQVYNCLCLLLKYHALGLGVPASELVPAPRSNRVRDFDAKKMPLGAAYIASSSNLVDILSKVVTPSGNSEGLRSIAGGFLQDTFAAHFSLYDGYLSDTTVAKQIHAFLELNIAACTDPQPGPVTLYNVLEWADKLTTVVLEDAQADSQRQNPLDFTMWSAAVVAFSLYVADVNNKELAKFATKRLEDLRVELQNKSDAFHRNYGLEWFFGGKMEHWSDVLLAMIAFVGARRASANDGPGNVAVVTDFARVMEKGWLGGVLWFAKE
ncbi:hypothetical protein H2200_008155 [Cladophialophora chaetospira]|uniref:Zn(2)-C6 fungal-type domain-containing protein n=1 Tax=Cladophialophora chaetospira TaxID=386627 RepID=A0AA38X585_9EURO|nr:hypothetical protein H2200_008155 [Cladophialophora chaetospira]